MNYLSVELYIEVYSIRNVVTFQVLVFDRWIHIEPQKMSEIPENTSYYFVSTDVKFD